MAKAIQLASGNWYIRVNDYKEMVNGKPKWRYKGFTAPTKRAAEYMALEYKEGNKRNKPCDMTVMQCVNGYIESRRNMLSPSTIASYKQISNRYFGELDFPIKNLTDITLQLFFNNLSATLSPKTLQNVKALLIASVKFYDRTFDPHIYLPEKAPKKIEVPSIADFQRLLDYSNGLDIYLPILLAGSMGLRRSEIVALTVDDYDPIKKTLSIHSAIVLDENNMPVRKKTKTSASTRSVIAPAFTATAIELYIADKSPTDNLTGYDTPTRLTRNYQRMTIKIGMERYTFHTLRHFYASIMLSENTPMKYAMEMMGHSTDNMLKNVYQHTMEEKSKEITNKLNSAFSNILE